MTDVFIYCEGDTERSFVERKLRPYMMEHGVSISSVMCNTSKNHSGMVVSGGVSSYSKVKTEIRRYCSMHPECIVTTMLDFYGFPMSEIQLSASDKAEPVKVEAWIQTDIGRENCIFNFSVHEFEAILLTDPSVFGQFGRKTMKAIEDLRRTFPNPEDVDTDYHHCPSRRLISLIPRYSKTRTAEQIYSCLSMEDIRTQCPHFNDWISKVLAASRSG